MSEELQDDKEIVLVAVKKFSWTLRNASERLRNDKEVVIAAVTQNGFALQYAPERLQIDKEVIHAAIMQLLTEKYNNLNPGSIGEYEDEYEYEYEYGYEEEDEEENGFKKVVSLICKLLSKQVLTPLDIIHVASAEGSKWNHGMS